MEPKSTPNHEKLVLGVPWGLPGGTLGPERGQSEKKGGTWDFLTPPLGAHFETFLRQSRQKVDLRRRFFREPSQAPFLEANCRKRGHHSPAKCSKIVGFYRSGAKSPCYEKSRLDEIHPQNVAKSSFFVGREHFREKTWDFLTPPLGTHFETKNRGSVIPGRSWAHRRVYAYLL